MGDLVVSLDGVDFSGCALSGSATRRLNRPAQASIRIPMDCAAGCSRPGQRLKISFDAGASVFFHGMVMDWELDSGEDDGYIVMNALDPMELWQWRVARDDTGDFTVPTFIEDYVTGPEIMEDILMNTEGDSTAQGNAGLSPPVTAEGPTFLTFGSFATGGCDLTGAPVDWPMTIGQVFSLLGSTGCVDLVITPSDPGGDIMGTIDGYNGDYGTDLSGSVVFEYATGAPNVRALRWNQDMSSVINKNQYFLGPRVQTEADPAGDQHWRANITGFDTDLPYPPGGQSVDVNNDPMGPPWTDNPLGECIYNSRIAYGVRMQVNIYDARGDEATVGRELYRRLWQSESWLRQNPRTLIHVTPIRGYPLGTFDIGDLVGVTIGSGICGGISGAQRVYQYTVSWDENGPFELSELQTSSDTGVETGV